MGSKGFILKKLKVMSVVGTRPEIIRLSRVFFKLDTYCDHKIVHTGQNYDYELNEIFFNDLGIKKPKIFLGSAAKNASKTIGNIISDIDDVLMKEKPDAFLVLGDTNSCLSAITAKRHKVPIFHMEAGNRCFDQRVPEEINRKIVDQLLSKMSAYIDVIVPRGGKGLVAKVQKFSNVHVIGHLEGLCHIYVDKTANIKMARDLIINAKMRRTSICGAVESVLIEEKALNSHAKEIINALLNSGCEVRVDKKINKIFKGKLKKTTEKDWKTEYLDAIISIKTVKNVEAAVEHILKYGTMHTDSIITNSKKNAEIFLNGVNSSIAMHNVSTQFADGGEFGFGGEIGISTNKLPPRGPVGINQLTSYKYLVSGKGIIRP